MPSRLCFSTFGPEHHCEKVISTATVEFEKSLMTLHQFSVVRSFSNFSAKLFLRDDLHLSGADFRLLLSFSKVHGPKMTIGVTFRHVFPLSFPECEKGVEAQKTLNIYFELLSGSRRVLSSFSLHCSAQLHSNICSNIEKNCFSDILLGLQRLVE